MLRLKFTSIHYSPTSVAIICSITRESELSLNGLLIVQLQLEPIVIGSPMKHRTVAPRPTATAMRAEEHPPPLIPHSSQMYDCSSHTARYEERTIDQRYDRFASKQQLSSRKYGQILIRFKDIHRSDNFWIISTCRAKLVSYPTTESAHRECWCMTGQSRWTRRDDEIVDFPVGIHTAHESASSSWFSSSEMWARRIHQFAKVSVHR
jgi:hypothetical protein